MKNCNLAQVVQEQQAVVVPFPKQGRQAMSDQFEKGFIMKSRLFHNEVEPFLSDAAKNVYSALMGFIGGFNKASDHISTRQIQGGKLKGSNKLGSATVNNGIKELVWFGVVTVLEVNYRIGNKYRINEVSLIEAFEKIDAKKIKALRLQNSTAFISEAVSASVSEASIDIIYIYSSIDKTLSHFVKNPLKVNFYCFQEFLKTNPSAHIKTFVDEMQKREIEEKTKAEAERKDKARKLSFDEVINLTANHFKAICDFNLWEQYVSSRSMTAKTKLTKNALKLIYKDLKAWGFDGANESLKRSINGNYQGLFAPKATTRPVTQTQASTRMDEIKAIMESENEFDCF